MSSNDPKTLPRGLYVLCDDGAWSAGSVLAQAELLLAGGAKVLQLRMKKTPVREALSTARAVFQMARAAGAVCLVNDRVDVALISGADGVHLGDEDLAPEDARAVLGPKAIIGVTVRDAQSAQKAKAAGATYVGAGPVFGTTSKRVQAPVMGVEALRALVAASPLPVIGIGGIAEANIEAVAQSGVHGAAVLSDLLQAASPARQVEVLTRAFARGSERV